MAKRCTGREEARCEDSQQNALAANEAWWENFMRLEPSVQDALKRLTSEMCREQEEPACKPLQSIVKALAKMDKSQVQDLIEQYDSPNPWKELVEARVETGARNHFTGGQYGKVLRCDLNSTTGNVTLLFEKPECARTFRKLLSQRELLCQHWGRTVRFLYDDWCRERLRSISSSSR